ncbi:hypothetical protein J0A66_10420 [Bowmanella dokdonensis]|uniref:Uncharacterized protein n=1 Tax=Bowmanella dokdonensis TaxID=751969 RepID=A0A939DPM3_9ALTE|nr:hypothetical protein [Bowmanella dokdonensis]MBN7825636.1 hypothetical protein [Bowmanella dokdonensis]
MGNLFAIVNDLYKDWVVDSASNMNSDTNHVFHDGEIDKYPGASEKHISVSRNSFDFAQLTSELFNGPVNLDDGLWSIPYYVIPISGTTGVPLVLTRKLSFAFWALPHFFKFLRAYERWAHK